MPDRTESVRNGRPQPTSGVEEAPPLMSSLTPEQRQLRARIAAAARWAAEPDRAAATQKARDARWQGFIDKARQLAPEGSSDEEIFYRAEMLRKQHMATMALASARGRRLRRKSDDDAA